MTEATLHEARAFLRAHSAGELQFDEHIRPLKIVIAPDGRIVAPVMVAMLEAADTVLFLPEANDASLQAQVTLEKFDECGPNGDLADRWRIYHGEPADVNWAFLHIDAAKFHGALIDGEALKTPNPLTADEARLCRETNEKHRDGLRDLIQRKTGLSIEAPTMVGIDPGGLDARGPFDIIRVEFDQPIADPSQVDAFLHALLVGM
jgi:hypothetical protein